MFSHIGDLFILLINESLGPGVVLTHRGYLIITSWLNGGMKKSLKDWPRFVGFNSVIWVCTESCLSNSSSKGWHRHSAEAEWKNQAAWLYNRSSTCCLSSTWLRSMASAFRSLSRRRDSWLFLGSVKFCCDVQCKCMSQIGINIDQGTAYLEFTETLKDENANANVVKNLRSHSQLVPEMELLLALDSKCSSISPLPLTHKPFLGGKYEILLFCILTAEKYSNNFGSPNCCRSQFFPRPPNYLPWWTPLCVHVCSVVSDSLWPHGLGSARLLCPWNFPGKNTEVDCHFLLQGIFLTQGLNLNLLHWQADPLHWATWEVACKTLILYPLNDNSPFHLGSLPVNHQKLIQKHETYTLAHSSLK